MFGLFGTATDSLLCRIPVIVSKRASKPLSVVLQKLAPVTTAALRFAPESGACQNDAFVGCEVTGGIATVFEGNQYQAARSRSKTAIPSENYVTKG